MLLKSKIKSYLESSEKMSSLYSPLYNILWVWIDALFTNTNVRPFLCIATYQILDFFPWFWWKCAFKEAWSRIKSKIIFRLNQLSRRNGFLKAFSKITLSNICANLNGDLYLRDAELCIFWPWEIVYACCVSGKTNIPLSARSEIK